MREIGFDYEYRISANFEPKLKKFQHLWKGPIPNHRLYKKKLKIGLVPMFCVPLPGAPAQ
jgi:hypothetical protein